MSTNYGHLIVAVLDDCYRRFGPPLTPADVADQAAWVRCRVEDIRAGRSVPVEPPVRDLPANDDAWTRYRQE